MRKSVPIFAALLCTVALSSLAQADTGLVMRCDGAVAVTQAAACTGSRTWVHPSPGDAVLSYPSVALDSTKVAWNDANLQFRPWISILGNFGVLICAKDLSVAQQPIGAVGGDQCAPGPDAIAKVFVKASNVVIAAVPPSTPPPTSTSTATLAWVVPTVNDDGSPLTDLTGFDVYQGPSIAALTKITTAPLPANATGYIVSGLQPGTYYFAVTSVNSASLESVQSQSGSKTIARQVHPGPPTSFTVTVTVTAP